MSAAAQIKVLVIGSTASPAGTIIELISDEPRLLVVGRSFALREPTEPILNTDVVVIVEQGITSGDAMAAFARSPFVKNVQLLGVCLMQKTVEELRRLGGGVDAVLLRPDALMRSGLPSTRQELVSRLILAHATRSRFVTLSEQPISPPAPAAGAAGPARSGFSGIIAIGASTGGTEATASLLKNLPGGLPGMVIVQHMPPGFTTMYAERLNRDTPHTVAEASGRQPIQTGHVLVAPGNMHMRVVRREGQLFAETFSGERVNGHCPSVDVLFDSVAAACGKNAIGVILTGMGGDGAQGLLKMRQAGAYTIGQDAGSCVVYGMPKVAFDIGAVNVQSPIKDMPAVLLRRL